MINQIKHSYNNLMEMDITKSKYPNTCYYKGYNIRVVSDDGQSNESITNEKGNELLVKIPSPYIDITVKKIFYLDKELSFSTNELNFVNSISGIQYFLGSCLIRDNFIIFSTDNSGFDCIWKLNEKDFSLDLLYVRNLNFSLNHPIQSINNYENEKLDKIYWVDGNNQMRFFNIHHSILNGDLENLIDLNLTNIEMVGTFDLSQPVIKDITFGGVHTAGVIQYAYNLFKLNGSQTKISPLSEVISLKKETGGGEVNEVVGLSPIVHISNLDSKYTNLKLYSIKYTSFNEVPEVSLIADKQITGLNEFTYYDDGRIIQNISLEDFLFLGSDLIIPKHINSKNNILFLSNYKEKNFDVDLDCRAYSFPTSSFSTVVYNSLVKEEDLITSNEVPLNITTSSFLSVPKEHSCININYDFYSFISNSSELGGEGFYLKYKIKRNQVGINNFTIEDSKKTFLKEKEIYRLGIIFYNKYGKESLPKWIADFKVLTAAKEEINLSGFYASLELELKDTFYNWLYDNNNFLNEDGIYDEFLKPVGYKLLRADRTLLDRTIICQGLINGCLSQVPGDTSGGNDMPDQIEKVLSGNKIPSLMRGFDDTYCPLLYSESFKRVDRFSPEDHPEFNPGVFPFTVSSSAGNEVFKAVPADEWSSGTYQFNKLMQFFSPEITFNQIQSLQDVNFHLIGALENNQNNMWHQNRDINTKTIVKECKVNNCIYPHDNKAYLPGNFQAIKGERHELFNHGLIGHSHGDGMNFTQIYRSYTGEFYRGKNNGEESLKVCDNPKILETGQSNVLYNNDSQLRFYNTLQPLSADAILNFTNSFSAKSAIFALGDRVTPNNDRIEPLNLFTDEILSSHPLANFQQALLSEFRINKDLIYLGNIYGGNSYESKKRTNYIEVGEYQKIENNKYNCLHFGDTYVQNFKFTKLVKTDTEVYTRSSYQLTEIINFKVETTVNLECRNDLSNFNWDNIFQPKYEDYQKYNRVYSQIPNLIIRRDLDYKFKKINSFDTNVISSKPKISGEIIDSWTDVLVNNTLTLDGKFGSINGLFEFNNELFTFQDNAVAFLSIQPRIQTTGSDGLEIQLGTGNILQEYRYITTTSGTKNKWSVIKSPTSLYYFDSLNKSLNSIINNGQSISDYKGLQTFTTLELNNSFLLLDNPLISSGVTGSYDFNNQVVYFTFLQQDKSFTLSYNEKKQRFESFYDFLPTSYISRGSILLMIDPSNTNIYQHYKGDYNKFFEQFYPSYITILTNPTVDRETIFNNIEFKSEVYLNNQEVFDKTVNKIQVYNEYQDTGLVNLIFSRNGNLKRKFRNWSLEIPRNQNTRQRIRNPWTFIKLQFDNTENLKLILHDLIISFTN